MLETYQPGVVSIGCSVLAGWLPRVLLPPDEHDAFHCLPMNTTTMQFLCSKPTMYTNPGHMYARVGIRDPSRMYVRGRIFFLTLAAVRTCTCYVRASTTTRASLYTDQYVRTRSRQE